MGRSPREVPMSTSKYSGGPAAKATPVTRHPYQNHLGSPRIIRHSCMSVGHGHLSASIRSLVRDYVLLIGLRHVSYYVNYAGHET